VSFLLTAALACGTVIFSYFVGALPDGWLIAADYAIIHKWRCCKQCKERYEAEVNGTGAEKVATSKCEHNDWDIIERRRDGLNTFILTLSDQQLVTGLAMMIAALVRHCSLSYYEFSVVANLAWLSSTTHLTTLIVLQPYLETRPILRWVRVIGIFCNLVLLLYFTLVTSAASAASADGSASIQCVIDDLPHLLRRARSDFSTWVSVWFLLDSHWAAMSDIDGYRVKFWKGVARNYCRWFLNNTEHIPEILGSPNSSPGHERQRQHKSFKTRRFVSWNRCSGSDIHLTDESFDAWGGWYFERPRKAFRWSPKWFIGSAALHPLAIFEDYSMSFFSAIPIFLWSLSYGITGTVLSRQLKPSVEGSENEVDFGQIVPLFLLVLPLLAGLETYYGIALLFHRMMVCITNYKPDIHRKKDTVSDFFLPYG
jgi:hypothetical protein